MRMRNGILQSRGRILRDGGVGINTKGNEFNWPRSVER